MSAAYVRSHYSVPAKRGMRVVVDGISGVIVGFDGAHLRVRLHGIKGIQSCHPTWRVEYPQDAPQEPRDRPYEEMDEDERRGH